MDGRFAIMSALLLIARAEEAARSRACAHHRQSDTIDSAARLVEFTQEAIRKDTSRSMSSDKGALHTLYGQWAGQRAKRQTSHPNDIHQFGPVEAKFTLSVNTSEQVDAGGALLFVVFLVSFLLTLLLVTLSGAALMVLRRRRTRHTKGGFNEEAGPYEGMSDITALANEEAAFEDKFVDIVMLEEPQNMSQALDSLTVASLSRAALAQERVRVRLFRGLLSVLLAGVRAAGRLTESSERRVLGVVHGQIVGMEGKVQEEHVTRMAALAAQCNLETQEELESQQLEHMSENTLAERLSQHQQDELDLSAVLQELHQRERRRLQKRLLLRHERASAQAHRQQALRRRSELHKIFGEELEEAVRTGELEKHTADVLLLQYYSCQDALEEVLDVLLANQRALLAERHAQRHFLLRSLQSLQSVTTDAFNSCAGRLQEWSAHTHGVSQQCSDLQLEILHIRQSLEESVSRERSTIRCDIIKRRRQILMEKVCEHWRQQQDVCGSSDVTVDQFLQKWTELLIHQNNELSELINQLDEETAAKTRKLSVCLLQSSVAQLKAQTSASCPGAVRLLPQTELIQERLQRLGKAAARDLRSTQSRIRLQQQQELREQSRIRDAFREYCSCLCACQPSLSHEQRLRLQLECVKAACRLDRCLVLHNSVYHDSSDPAVTLSDPAVTLSDPAVAERSSEVTELQRLQRSVQERLRRQDNDTHDNTHNDTLQQEQQLCVCQERLAVFVVSLQCERVESQMKAMETHTALLNLQTLITAELHDSDLTHTIHTHRQALEEAELRLQQEEEFWVGSADGRGLTDEDEEGVFVPSGDGGLSVLLQEALFKRHQLQRVADRVLRMNQTLKHQKEQHQMSRLQMYCEQDLVFTAALVKQSLMSVPDLHEVLRLLLPTVPEGELLSLMDALGPGAGDGSGRCSSLLDRLRQEVLHRHLTPRDRDRHRLRKKRRKLLDNFLFSAGGPEEIHETQQRRQRIRDLPETEPSLAEQTEAGLLMGADNEKAWPAAVALDSLLSIRDDSKEAGPVGGAQDSLVPMGDYNEGAGPVNGAQERFVSTDRLFVFRCVPPSSQQHTHTSHSRKKKRSFLNFKKASVAPQPIT